MFPKRIFPGENAGNMPEITVFWTFLKILSLVFCDILLKDAHQLYLNYDGIRFLVKIFFLVIRTGNMPEIAVLGNSVCILVTFILFIGVC